MKIPSLAWGRTGIVCLGGLCDAWLVAQVLGGGWSGGWLAFVIVLLLVANGTVADGLRRTFRSRAQRVARAEFVAALKWLGEGWFTTEDDTTVVELGSRGWWAWHVAYVWMGRVAGLQTIIATGSGVLVGDTYAVVADDARVLRRRDVRAVRWTGSRFVSDRPWWRGLGVAAVGALVHGRRRVGTSYAQPEDVRELVAQLRSLPRPAGEEESG